MTLTREESFRVHPKRHPVEMHYRVGCDAEGRLTAVYARMIGDTGAYASVGAKVLERAGGHAAGPYRVDNIDVEAKAVYTNNPPLRGHARLRRQPGCLRHRNLPGHARRKGRH